LPAKSQDEQLAEEHALEAERLLKGRFIWSYLKAQAHAALAVYYTARRERDAG